MEVENIGLRVVTQIKKDMCGMCSLISRCQQQVTEYPFYTPHKNINKKEGPREDAWISISRSNSLRMQMEGVKLVENL